MKKIIAALTLLITIISVTGCSLEKPPADTNQSDSQPVEAITEPTILIIDSQEFSLNNEAISNTTVYDILAAISSQNKINLKTKQYDFGLIIEAIGDKTNGDDNKYWQYYVNDEMPMVSADNYEITIGDRIEFKFESSNF